MRKTNTIQYNLKLFLSNFHCYVAQEGIVFTDFHLHFSAFQAESKIMGSIWFTSVLISLFVCKII